MCSFKHLLHSILIRNIIYSTRIKSKNCTLWFGSRREKHWNCYYFQSKNLIWARWLKFDCVPIVFSRSLKNKFFRKMAKKTTESAISIAQRDLNLIKQEKARILTETKTVANRVEETQKSMLNMIQLISNKVDYLQSTASAFNAYFH